MSIANISIVGNLVKAPQQLQFASGKNLTSFVVAVDTPGREKRGGGAADFYKVEAWGKLGELAAHRLSKGNRITANGRLEMDKWLDKEGRERMSPKISAIDIAFPPRSNSGSHDDDMSPRVASSTSRSGTNNIARFTPRIASQGEAQIQVHPDEIASESDSNNSSDSNSTSPECASSEDDDAEYDEDEIDDDDDDDEYESYGEPDSRNRPAPMRKLSRAPA